MKIDQTTGQVVDAALKVHSALGPGLLESAYQACLVHELFKRRINVIAGLRLPIVYEGLKIDVGYRLDLVVENSVIVELKAVSKIIPIHQAQLLSYLKLSGLPVGLLINFHVRHLKHGITRMVNNL